MSRTPLACLAAVAIACAIGARLDGPVGVGLVAGALLGGGVGMIGHGFLRRSLEQEFEASLRALLAGFCLKLVGLVGAWAALVFVPALGAIAAATPFLLAYVGTAAVLLAVSSLDLQRALAARPSALPLGVAANDSGDPLL